VRCFLCGTGWVLKYYLDELVTWTGTCEPVCSIWGTRSIAMLNNRKWRISHEPISPTTAPLNTAKLSSVGASSLYIKESEKRKTHLPMQSRCRPVPAEDLNQQRWGVSDANSIAYCLHSERDVGPCFLVAPSPFPVKRLMAAAGKERELTKQASEVMSESIWRARRRKRGTENGA
jgi:hypothetical protein